MTDIIKSILAINPNAQVSVNAEDINQITWLNDTQPIPDNQILAKQIELLNMATPEILAGVVSPEEIQSRQNVQGYIQKMQSVLTNR